jgi:hypothetical protein
MNLGEAKQKALSLMAEYSVDGVLTPDGDNADYLNRMNRFADISQKEIAQVKKIHSKFSISQNPIKSQIGLLKGFEIQQRLDKDIVYEFYKTKSYYFEVDNVATIYIEENVSGVWTVLQTINNTAKRQFTSHKGLISASNPNNQIRLRFSGTYPYNIRHIAMYEYSFPTVEDVPDYIPYVKYQVPSDFMELQKVIQTTETRQYREMIDYYWEGKRTFVVNYYYNGQFDIHYYRYPTPITKDTPDDYEFEVDVEGQEAIPFFLAARAIMDENQTLAIQLLNEYQVKISRLFTSDEFGTTSITQNYGM